MTRSSSPHQNDGESISANERPTKRRRVAIACEKCRERKSRCNGAHPMCGACQSSKTDCVYPPPLSKTDQLRQEFSSSLHSLESRMHGIERLLERLEPHFDGTPGKATTPVSQPEKGLDQTPEGEITITEESLQRPKFGENLADGMGIVPLSNQDSGFFGPSSNISLLRRVSRALARLSGKPIGQRELRPTHGRLEARHAADATASPSFLSNAHAHMSRQNRSFTIPADHKAKALLDAWFANGGHIHAFVHRGTLMDTYEACRNSGFVTARKSWLALMYMLFALSAFSWPYRATFFAHNNTESERFYDTGADLCMKLIFEENFVNIEIVQCLVGMVMYLESTQNSTKTWSVLGIAIKLAYQLGIHSTSPESVDPIESETRKRIWFYLMFLDRTLSMSFGRPAEIQDSHLSLGPPRPFQDSSRRGILEVDASAVSFLCTNMGLHDVIHQTIQTLYGGNFGRIEVDIGTISTVYARENDLLNWAQGVPHQHKIMQIADFKDTDPSTSFDRMAKLSLRQRTVITLRFLNARILVHRPLLEGLLEAIQQSAPDLLSARAIRQASVNSVQVLVTCSVRLISIIHLLVASNAQGQQQLGSWWFSVYYTFNAALAIIGCVIVSRPIWGCPEILTSADRESAFSALDQSMKVLDGIDEGHSTLTICKAYLEELVRVAEPLRTQERLGDNEFPEYNLPSGMPFADFSAIPQPFVGHPSHAANMQTAQGPMSPFRQFISDAELENFLFPLDMQLAGGHMASTDQPLI